MTYNGHIVYIDKGYPSIKIERHNVAIHKLVWEEANGREVPPGHILHHRDEDKTNFALYNLELLTVASHAKCHNDIRERQRKLRETFNIKETS